MKIALKSLQQSKKGYKGVLWDNELFSTEKSLKSSSGAMMKSPAPRKWVRRCLQHCENNLYGVPNTLKVAQKESLAP